MIFDDFQNGQNLASVDFWQALLAKDADGALSVCRNGVAELPLREEAERVFAQQCSAVRQRLLRLLEAILYASKKIPQAQGFFTSTSDRAATYGAVCAFLELLKTQISALDSETLRFPELYRLLHTQDAMLFQVESAVLAMKKAARRTEHQAAIQADALLCQLEQYQIQGREILTRAKSLERSLEGFLSHTCREFCRFAVARADLEHEGQSASPGEISRLLWGLRQETERILKDF